jgi:hypothetical protein
MFVTDSVSLLSIHGAMYDISGDRSLDRQHSMMKSPNVFPSRAILISALIKPQTSQLNLSSNHVLRLGL